MAMLAHGAACSRLTSIFGGRDVDVLRDDDDDRKTGAEERESE